MRVALVNPRWSFERSIYFGCREEHLPLELGYAAALLEADGHEVLLLDGALDDLDNGALASRIAAFAPAMTVVTTAPTYLFWRCAQPELTVPAALARAIRPAVERIIAIGPHGSATPRAVLAKMPVDAVIMGEPEDIVRALAAGENARDLPSVVVRGTDTSFTPYIGRFVDLPPLSWPDAWIARHGHHHHRFDAAPEGPGAEVEASRGCPYNCSFCAKIDFRDRYRRRRLDNVLAEIDGLVAQGVSYIYFIDEIFLPQRPLLEALLTRPVSFGIQTRIDLWKPDMLELLGEAGCVSIEAGVESVTHEGREQLHKGCRITTDELATRLIQAKRHVPFVQANLLQVADDDERLLECWRKRLRRAGVWANDPVPLYPYPSSPAYRARFGPPDERAWERAHESYLESFGAFSELQDEQPLPLPVLEQGCRCA